MKLTFYGANGNVTGSRHLLTVNGKNVLLDCGLVQGHRAEANERNRNLLFDPATLDAVVLSHGHVDHCGALPLLVRQGFRGKIYGTPATMDIVPLMLRDCGHIQESDALTWNKRHKPKDAITPLYTLADAEAVDPFYAPLPYDLPTEIVPGLTVTLEDAGHILGSAIVIADLEENGLRRRLVFSGDLGREHLPILCAPARFGETDILLLESTYGDRLHDEYAAVEDRLVEIICKTARRGGKILVPAFALERTQELVYLLHRLHNAGRIPAIPIVVDSPLAGKLLGVFARHLELFDPESKAEFLDRHENPFAFPTFHVTESPEESKKLNDSQEPMIVISASGMCESGRILHHLANNLGDPRTTVLAVGYMAEGTLGRRLIEGEKQVKIYGDPVQVRAEVVFMSAFSAHADYQEQMKYLQGQRVRQAIYLVHGEEGPALAERDRLRLAGMAPIVEISRLGESLDLADIARGTAPAPTKIAIHGGA